MRATLLLYSGAVLWSLASAASPLEDRAACPNACMLSAFNKRPATARRDCSSFFSGTISPCPTTVTNFTTETITLAAVTATSVTDLTTFSSDTLTTTVSTSTQTDLETISITPTSTTTTETDPSGETDTVSDVSTVVVYATTTVTVTYTTVAYSPGMRRAVEVEARATGCTPKRISHTRLPTYAPPCGATPGNFVYSSACSCYGVSHAYTTLPRSTVSRTVTKTVTVTPTSTITITNTQDGGETTVTTQETTAFEETTSTDTITVTFTSTETVFVDATTTVSDTSTFTSVTATSTFTTTSYEATQTACPVVALNGSFAGQYLIDQNSRFGFVAGRSSGTILNLNGAGLFQEGTQHLIAVDYAPGFVFRPDPNGFHEGQNGGETFYSITCTVDSNNVLSCVSSDPTPRNNLFLNYPGNALVLGSQSDVTTYGWAPIVLAFDCEI